MTTAFQPNAFQPDAFQVEGGVTSGAITGSLDYTDRNDAFSGTAALAGDALTGAKYGSQKKKRPNQNIVFKGPRKRREEITAAAPALMVVKPSPLLLGLLAHGLPLPVEPEPALADASIPLSVVAEAPPDAVAEPEVIAPPPVPGPLEQMAADMRMLLDQVAQMRQEIAALRTAPPAPEPLPVGSSARDPLHEALHAILPGLSEPIDLDAEPPEPRPRRASMAPAPASVAQAQQRQGMTPAQLRAENERRAAIAVKMLLQDL